MYVCVCRAVTERHIDQAVQAGARNLRDLRAGLGVTVDCASCARHAHHCLRAAVQGRCSSPEPLAPPATTLHPVNLSLEAA